MYKTVAVGLCAVVFGIIPSIANAQFDDSSYGGGFFDDSSYGGSFFDDSSYGGGWYDDSSYGGSFSDDSSYGSGWYDDSSYGGSFFDDSSYGGGWYDDSSYGGGVFDDSSYGGNYSDYPTNYSDYPTNYSDYPTNYSDYPTNYSDYPTNYSDYPTDCGYNCGYEYNADCGCYEVAYDEYVEYGSNGGGFRMPSFGGMTIVPPRYSTPSYPSYPSYPTPRPTPPAPQPQPRPTPTQPSTPINIVNTNNNVNTNTNTNVTTVTPATAGPIVQYVAPQYYPTYLPNYYGQTYYGQTYYNQAPYCVITIGQGYMNGMISLTWSSQGATSAYITPSVGQVAPNGSTSLYSYGNTVYTMTVTGPGGTYTCRTQSYVAPYAPVSPYVSLTQIPYTGIAMGPIASAMYWTGMIALAIAGAYLLVYYKGGALALATSMISRSHSNEAEEAPVHTEEVKTSHIDLPTENPSMTRDAMKIVRSVDGTPRLVISRA